MVDDIGDGVGRFIFEASSPPSSDARRSSRQHTHTPTVLNGGMESVGQVRIGIQSCKILEEAGEGRGWRKSNDPSEMLDIDIQGALQPITHHNAICK